MSDGRMHLLLAGFLLLLPAAASADCIEEPRQVALDKANTVKLKAYRCGTEQGQKGSEFRFEFHRLSPTAASLVVGKIESALLRATLGAPKVLQNEVFDSYADLLKQFGRMVDVPKPGDENQATTSVSGADDTSAERVQDNLTARKVRTFPRSIGDFPMPGEITVLRKKTIPDGMKIFYTVICEDDDADGLKNPICRKYDVKNANQKFWRGLRADDIANYPQRVKDYNALLAKYLAELRAARKTSGNPPEKWQFPAVPSELRLLKYAAGDNWPDDLALVAGFRSPDACNPQQIADWSFTYYARDVQLDVALIENTSARPVRIGALLGSRVSEPRLRAASPVAASAPGPLGDMAETLAPGQKLLVPTAVVLVPPRELRGDLPYPRMAEDAYRQRGGGGYKGNPTAFGAPTIRDYLFGAALTLSGIVVDDRRVDLAQRSANFFDLTLSSETGSCPYLLSLDDAERDWTNHGKVLHRAIGKPREETESRTFEGWRARFRLEEREPELARIDSAALHVTLATGATLLLEADHPDLTARDGRYVELFWGEAVDFGFELPAGVRAGEVVSSRLELTGYYERYSSLLAGAPSEEQPALPASLVRRAGSGPARSVPAACPMPVARPWMNGLVPTD
jgi:hypothetical protein